MKNINTMTKNECMNAINRMFGFDTYRGLFSPNDDIKTLRALVESQRDKYLVILNGR